MVRFVAMTTEEFSSWAERSVEEYAEDHVRAGNWNSEDAMQLAAEQFAQLLPNGQSTRNHYLYSIEDETTAEKVGIIWFAVVSHGQRNPAFIYDFLIFENFRGRGYAKKALLSLEQRVKELDLDTISLHVFGFNHVARSLYEKMGYVATDIVMSKKLS